MSDWMSDMREIRAARLAAYEREYSFGTGDRFERFERPGEYCMLPWLRVTTWRLGYEQVIEAPLTQVVALDLRPAALNEPAS